MHPIIKEFVETPRPLNEIVERLYDKSNIIETVLQKLCRLKNVVLDIDPRIYDEIDQATIQGHSDANVYMLFVGVALDFISRRKHSEKSKALLAIGASISIEKIHPIVHAIYLVTNGTLKFYENKMNEGRVILRQALSIVNKDQPRYMSILLGYASLISQEGRLNDLEQEELNLIFNSTYEKFRFLIVDIKLSNYIFTGNVKKGLEQFEEYKRLFPADATYIVEGKKNLLHILSGDFDETNYSSEKFKIYSNICKNLLQGNIPAAEKYLHIIQSKNWENATFLPFEKYLPLHIALGFKNKGKARLLLQEYFQNGSADYLDDFFLARLHLLEQNLEEAQTAFTRLMSNIHKYEAMNRLTFELQFAKELKSTDVLILMSGSKESPNLNIGVQNLNPHSKQKKQNKGTKQLIGDSQEITQVKKLIKQFANLREPVLITGETGTGKELVAKAIHEESPFSNEPFLAINCGALTDSLLQSELFGYIAGAFTGAQKERKGIFEAAGNGTVFLDEFGEISTKLQISLLRVLESNEIRPIGSTTTRQIKCKIIIASNIDLYQAVNEKKFREDLYYRLTRYDIKLPPLRVRTQDIELLIKYFMDDKHISKQLLDALIHYSWPGNIRELKNELERLKILHSEKSILGLEDFDFSRLQGFVETNTNLSNETHSKIPLSFNTNERTKDINEEEILKIVQRGSKVEQRHEFIKDLFRKYKKLTRGQIMEIAKISPVTATKDMEILCQSGFIERKTPTKSVKSHYFILTDSK